MDTWPDIPFEPWKETCATLHLWTQIVGKYRLARTPWVNHSWHATHYVSSRGLTTSQIPAGDRTVQFDFDFFDAAIPRGSSHAAREQPRGNSRRAHFCHDPPRHIRQAVAITNR